MNKDERRGQTDQPDQLGRMAKLIGAVVAVLSVLACIILAAIRSVGLESVSVTAIDAKAEPRDHSIPLIKQKEALPDYEIVVHRTDGEKVKLGTRPNESAANGLTWKLNQPIAVVEIAGIRLLDQDKLVSDEIAEVQLTADTVVEGNYRFEFESARSFGVGVGSFFRTPIGKAITGAFFAAIVLLILSLFRAGRPGTSIVGEVASMVE